MLFNNANKTVAINSRDENGELVLHKVVHCQQRFNWDCGVACVMMLLSEEQRSYFLRNFTAICKEEGFNQSTWTIDLCYLLKRFGIKHTMYTTMLGVNEDYKKHSYYSRILDLDRDRVVRKFADAVSSGVDVCKRALSPNELTTHLRERGPAILLVDATRLDCQWCRAHTLTLQLKRWMGMGYRGHYVVGAGARGGALLYRDPARPPRLCAARAAALLAHPNTDHDVVLLHRPYTSSIL